MKKIIADLKKEAAAAKKEMERLQKAIRKTTDDDEANELMDQEEKVFNKWIRICAALDELKWIEEM